LAAKLERQQRQLRDGFTARDDKIGLLNEALRSRGRKRCRLERFALRLSTHHRVFFRTGS
jgi:hypothetical protein